MLRGIFILGLMWLSTEVYSNTHLIYFSYPTYSPSGLSVKVGDTLVWKGNFQSFPMVSRVVPQQATGFAADTGTTFSYVVTAEGTYQYFCSHFKEVMKGYFIAQPRAEKNDTAYNPVVYISYYGHAFHLLKPEPAVHKHYIVTVTNTAGVEVYRKDFSVTEKDTWVAIEAFLPGSYTIVATDGVHRFERKFSK